MSHDTGEFTCDAIRHWCQQHGSMHYPTASSIEKTKICLITMPFFKSVEMSEYNSANRICWMQMAFGI
jgi:hypothetical protein